MQSQTIISINAEFSLIGCWEKYHLCKCMSCLYLLKFVSYWCVGLRQTMSCWKWSNICSTLRRLAVIMPTLYRRLSLWQPSVPSVMTKLASWQPSVFSAARPKKSYFFAFFVERFSPVLSISAWIITHWSLVTHICVGNLTSLIQIMACRLVSAKPLS